MSKKLLVYGKHVIYNGNNFINRYIMGNLLGKKKLRSTKYDKKLLVRIEVYFFDY